MTYKELKEILWSVHDRFTYTSDISQFGKPEHWMSFDEIPEGRFSGDCDDFAQAIRKEVSKVGGSSRLAVCGVNSDTLNHAVALVDCSDGITYICDNIHKWPMRKSELATYKFISVSGYETGDPWREII